MKNVVQKLCPNFISETIVDRNEPVPVNDPERYK